MLGCRAQISSSKFTSDPLYQDFLSRTSPAEVLGVKVQAAALIDLVQAKEMSMWFGTDTDLTVWQRFREIATPTVMESYRDVVLGSRQAWQFTKIQAVKILSYWPEGHQVNV